MRREHDRVHPRLKGYDYGQAGAYFVTVCAAKRYPLFSAVRSVVGPDDPIGPGCTANPVVELTKIGQSIEKYIKGINVAYPTVNVTNYVIMPDHIHLLIVIGGTGPMGSSGPTLPQIVKAFKHLVTKEVGYSVWQSNYHDHIIRNEADYLAHWTYIDENPACWTEDEYFCE